MQTQRHLKRRHLVYYPEVHNTMTGEPMGRLGDLTDDGIMLFSDHSLPLHREYKISIELTQMEELQRKSLELTMETLWSKRDQNPSLVCTGCKLISPSEDERKLIEQLIDSFGFFN